MTTALMENSTKIPLHNTTVDMEDDQLKSTMKAVMDYILIGLMAVIMLSLGCSIKVASLKKTFRRPIGIGIGLFCQFILYPPLTFGLAHMLQLTKWNALGMIILGTCPGGSLSNIATYWAKGDVTLSVSMTAVSTAVAIGMMPLNLWIYSRSWTDESAVIPYVNIVVALVAILVPVAFGMLILIKLPKAAKWILKIGGVIGFLMIIFTVGVSSYMYPGMYQQSWRFWFSSAGLPVFGLLLGYTLSSLACRPQSQRRAIAIEISSQNVALCLALVSISFDEDTFLKVLLYPELFGVFSIIELIVFAWGYRLISYLRNRLKSTEPEKPVPLKMYGNGTVIDGNMVNDIIVFENKGFDTRL